MKQETLYKKLHEQGFATDSCLKWHIQDVEIALKNRLTPMEIASMSDLDRQMILDDFFNHHADYICEVIGDLLVTHLENLEVLTPSKEIF